MADNKVRSLDAKCPIYQVKSKHDIDHFRVPLSKQIVLRCFKVDLCCRSIIKVARHCKCRSIYMRWIPSKGNLKKAMITWCQKKPKMFANGDAIEFNSHKWQPHFLNHCTTFQHIFKFRSECCTNIWHDRIVMRYNVCWERRKKEQVQNSMPFEFYTNW